MRIFCLTGLAFALISAAAGAQDTSTTTTQSGAPTVTTDVKSATVVYVSGNDLVVKGDDGQVKHFVVPDSTTVTVDGQQLSVHDLKPGMHLTRTITTTTTPTTVSTVRTISGKVWMVQAPNYVILTLPNGTNKQYAIPKDQKFMVDGREYDAFGLKKGMKITATVVTESPQLVASTTRAVTGTAPPPPPAPATPPPQKVLLIAVPVSQPPPQQEQATTVAQASLPKTASLLPLFALIGLVFVGTGLALRLLSRA
jgi:hypothetical protein